MIHKHEIIRNIAEITACNSCSQRDECNQSMQETCHDFKSAVEGLEINWDDLPVMVDRNPLPPPLFYKEAAERYEALLERKRREAVEALKDTTKLLQTLELLNIKPPSVEEILNWDLDHFEQALAEDRRRSKKR